MSETAQNDPLMETVECPTCGQSTTSFVLQSIYAEQARRAREEWKQAGGFDLSMFNPEARDEEAPAA
jgi:hypothetical protein